MKTLLIFIAGFLCHSSTAQVREPLRVGEPLPTVFQSVLADYANRPLIIDLFNTYCVICFRMMPKVDSLKQIFSDEINFLLIGQEDGKIQSVFEKFRKNRKITLPVVFDSIIFNRVSIDYVPLYLWLDKKGILQAVTGPDELTPANLQLFLSNQYSHQKEKSVAFNPMEPLLMNGNGGNDSNFKLRSVFSHWQRGQPNYMPLKLGFVGNKNMFQVLGATPAQLYLYAHLGKASWNYGDPLYGQYLPEVDMDIADSFRYCYSIAIKDDRVRSLQEVIKRDLSTFFGYEVRWQEVDIEGWKLVADGQVEKKLSSTGGTSSIKKSWDELQMQNVTIHQLLAALARYTNNKTVLRNASNIIGNIDIHVKANMENWEEIRYALSQKGLCFEPEKRKVLKMVLFLPDKNVAAN